MTEQNCPHCGDKWTRHTCRYGVDSCEICGCRWPAPKPETPPSPPPPEYPYDGVISAKIVYNAFWAAASVEYPGPFSPYFDQEMDMVDTSGCGMPSEFWEHMARALASPSPCRVADTVSA